MTVCRAGESEMDLLQSPIPRISRHHNKCALAILLVVVFVYLANLSPHWWVGKDGALYLCLGRNLARGEGYTLAGEAHTLVPPGFPAMLAGLIRIRADSFLAINVVMGSIGLATVLMGYLLLRQLVHRDWALLLVLLFALLRELVQRSGEVLSDVPFALLLITALWLYLRGLRQVRPTRNGWEIASLLLVVSCWVRMVGFLAAAGAGVGLVLSGWRKARIRALLNLVILVTGCAATVAVYHWYAASFGDPQGASYLEGLRHYRSSLSIGQLMVLPLRRACEASEEYGRLLIGQRMPSPLCIVLVLIPGLAGLLIRIRQGEWIGPLTVVAYVGGMAAVGAAIRVRYLLPIAPLLILYFFEGWVWIFARPLKFSKVPVAAVAVILSVAVLGFNLPLVARLIYWKHCDDYPVEQQSGKWRDLPAAVGFLKAHRPVSGAIIADFAYGYLADIPCPLIPRHVRRGNLTHGQIDALLRKWDVRFVVLDADDRTKPLYIRLREYFQSIGPPDFEQGTVLIHSVPQSPPSSRPVSVNETDAPRLPPGGEP